MFQTDNADFTREIFPAETTIDLFGESIKKLKVMLSLSQSEFQEIWKSQKNAKATFLNYWLTAKGLNKEEIFFIFTAYIISKR